MATAKKTPRAPAPVRKPAPRKSVAVKAAPKPATLPAFKAVAAPKTDRPKKPKLVRDSFTIPKIEFAVLQDLKQRAAKSGTAAKKSEILRAGIKALAAMNDAAFAAAMGAVPPIKTGRPAKE
ncbi:MAG: hypothetical protein H7322_16900 [Ramlibacter sp.]|nr:hypothetical protein [Ramlibacter sp.]